MVKSVVVAMRGIRKRQEPRVVRLEFSLRKDEREVISVPIVIAKLGNTTAKTIGNQLSSEGWILGIGTEQRIANVLDARRGTSENRIPVGIPSKPLPLIGRKRLVEGAMLRDRVQVLHGTP
jgi:hypothetical protein